MNNTDTINKHKTVSTKIKFERSHTGALAGYISRNNSDGRILGVRRDSPYPKKICLLDPSLANYVMEDVLYDVKMIPMHTKKGYIVVEATPTLFPARIEVTYVPKAIYRIEVKFGNQTILYDPHEGKKESVKSMSACMELLSKCLNIKNLDTLLLDFQQSAWDLLDKYRYDGFIYKKCS